MADDDTFDIDIYGDDAEDGTQKGEVESYQQEEGANGDTYGYDGNQEDLYEDYRGEEYPAQAGAGGENDQTRSPTLSHEGPNEPPHHGTEEIQKPSTPSARQGTKRKAESEDYGDDEQRYTKRNSQPAEPGATTALKLADLHWWTTEEDLRSFCAKAESESELKDLSLGEHKINGKSRGEAYMEFSTAEAASATKRELEREPEKPTAGMRNAKFSVYFSHVGNPFRTGSAAGAPVKRDFGNQNQARGGYNNYGNRGNFGSRGGYNQNRGGGYNNGINRFNNQAQQGGNWGMNGGYGGGGGGGFQGNPMMGGFGNMGMGGYGGMNRGGGMMGMNRGGMNMGMMGMGMNRGGMMGGMNMGMMGRGGWGGGGGGGGGFQQGNMQQGYGGGGGGGGGGGQ